MHIAPIYAFVRTAKIKQLNVGIDNEKSNGDFDGDADLDYSSEEDELVYATNRFDDELTDLIKIVRNDEEDEVDDDEDILQDAFLA